MSGLNHGDGKRGAMRHAGGREAAAIRLSGLMRGDKIEQLDESMTDLILTFLLS